MLQRSFIVAHVVYFVPPSHNVRHVSVEDLGELPKIRRIERQKFGGTRFEIDGSPNDGIMVYVLQEDTVGDEKNGPIQRVVLFDPMDW